MKRPSFILFLAIIASLLLFRPWVSAENPKNVQRISVDEIGRSVQLIGRLGVPLGEKMEITGNWYFPKAAAKDGSIRFSVTVVNGKTLDEPLEFNHEQVSFTDKEHQNLVPAFDEHRDLEGQTWTLIAYETGRIQTTPDEYGSKSPVFPIAGMPYYTKPFTSELIGVLQRNNGRTKR